MGDLIQGVGDLFGGAPNNAGFQAQGSNKILNPVNLNQTDAAYNQTQQGLQYQQQLINALNAQNGIQNQSNVFGQIQGVANGTGPNPALAQLNNATGANIANQAALMAGQRGAGANVGLVARQAGQQGAGIQQNAIGQAAALQAQQQMAALNQLGGLAGQQVAQQQQAVGNYNQFAQAQQQNLLGSVANQNQSNVGDQQGVNNANAGLAGVNAKNTSGTIGGIFNAGASAFGKAAGAAEGGEVTKSGMRLPPHLQIVADIHHPEMFGCGGIAYASGGKVDAMVSPGEVYLDPKEVSKVENGSNPISVGEKIPGKAKVSGNSYDNDTVPKKLEEGGIVIPKSIMESNDPAANAAKFVQAIKDKEGVGSEEGDFKAALKKAIMGRKNK